MSVSSLAATEAVPSRVEVELVAAAAVAVASAIVVAAVAIQMHNLQNSRVGQAAKQLQTQLNPSTAASAPWPLTAAQVLDETTWRMEFASLPALDIDLQYVLVCVCV